MADKDLTAFVGRALDRGIPRPQIEAALRKAGWSETEIRSAAAAYADVDLPLAVPRPRPSVSAHDAFIYLLMFLALGLSAFFLGALLFEIVDRQIEDALDPTDRRISDDWLRWCVSMLVVSFPLYLLTAWRAATDVAKNPAKRASGPRRWLTYVALFIAAAVLIGDLVALVYGFLRGDLTLRVALKVLIVAGIAGPIFFFYQRSVASAQEAEEAREAENG